MKMTIEPEPDSSNGGLPGTREESLKIALNSLFKGKRHLLVKEVPQAITALGESCRLLSELNGPLCQDNAEAHFYYGKALLEQSRMDLSVIQDQGYGAPVPEEDEEDEEEDEEGEGEEDADAEGECPMDEDDKNGEAEAEAAEVAEEKKEEDLSSEAEAESGGGGGGGDNGVTPGGSSSRSNNKNDADSSMVLDNEMPSTSKGVSSSAAAGGGGGGDPEEELGNLELAWEVLEVAKIGYGKQRDEMVFKISAAERTAGAGESSKSAGKDADADAEDADKENVRSNLEKKYKALQKRLAETHSLLGEVATESEIYSQAVDDFKMSLEIYDAVEEPDSREIAQIYFQLGLAHSFAKEFPASIDSFQKSFDIIKTRIENLKKKMENKEKDKGGVGGDGDKVEDNDYTEEKEIEELYVLLPELQEKINDTIDAEKDVKKSEEEEESERKLIQSFSPVKQPPNSNSNNQVQLQPANDISHLVKKRKKPEESSPSLSLEGSGSHEEPPEKKICPPEPLKEAEKKEGRNGH